MTDYRDSFASPSGEMECPCLDEASFIKSERKESLLIICVSCVGSPPRNGRRKKKKEKKTRRRKKRRLGRNNVPEQEERENYIAWRQPSR